MLGGFGGLCRRRPAKSAIWAGWGRFNVRALKRRPFSRRRAAVRPVLDRAIPARSGRPWRPGLSEPPSPREGGLQVLHGRFGAGPGGRFAAPLIPVMSRRDALRADRGTANLLDARFRDWPARASARRLRNVLSRRLISTRLSKEMAGILHSRPLASTQSVHVVEHVCPEDVQEPARGAQRKRQFWLRLRQD